MDNYFRLFPLVVLGGVLAVFVYRYLRFGSFAGMSVGARIKRELGSVESLRIMGMKGKLSVLVLERELGQPSQVAIAETTSGWLAWKYTAKKFTADEARKLARLLDEAVKG